jgi:hypothetical protein
MLVTHPSLKYSENSFGGSRITYGEMDKHDEANRHIYVTFRYGRTPCWDLY